MRIVVDSREQRPLSFQSDVAIVVRCLAFGDYAIDGHESEAVVERKSMSDLAQTLTWGRARFAKELAKLATADLKAIVVEGTMADALAGKYYSKVHGLSLVASCASIHANYGIATLWAGSPEGAAIMTRQLFESWLRRKKRLAA